MNNLHNQRHTFHAFILITVTIILVIISANPRKTFPLPQQKARDAVRLNILSKHLRVLKENNGEIIFTLPAGAAIRGDDSGFYVNKLIIGNAEHGYTLSAGGRSLNSEKYLVFSEKPGDIFKVTIDGEERSYPLPLEIVRDKGSLKLYINESPEQYAADSASAELGYIKPELSEAYNALALAIHGRCRINSLKGRHEGCDFCDLTCCQVYRGRRCALPASGPFINAAGTGSGLFFHSSSGGRLFSESVFSREGRRIKPPVDIIYSENLLLSRKLHRSWAAVLSRSEASEILYPGHDSVLRNISYDPDREIVRLESEKGSWEIAPEAFRLLINRVKGWNFIRSNNYTLTSDSANYIFRGAGLGHCTGLSLEGAVELAGRGYSRYEILEHYYPETKYLQHGNRQSSYQYVKYRIDTGEVTDSSTGPLLLNRRIPCGSIFKLFTVIYLAERRRDLLFNYSYNCTGGNPSPLPAVCWDKKGHGVINSGSAISLSCNVWFASLYNRIDQKDYIQWFNEFVNLQRISMSLPGLKNDAEWSGLLAGLDFRTDISVKDLIRISLFIRNADKNLTPDAAELILYSLRKTFISGTAEITGKDFTANSDLASLPPDLWGKTGTVIAGTNSHHSYGIFTGGAGNTGIITILRKGRGADAAHISVSLLKK